MQLDTGFVITLILKILCQVKHDFRQSTLDHSLVNQTTPSAALDVLHHQRCRGSGLVHETN